MRITTVLFAAALGTASSADAGIRTITEDFTDGMGGAAFDPELTFDFGTATDFTGTGDTNDLNVGELFLFADLVTVTLNTGDPSEYIESVEVDWVDFCGPGCTNLSVESVMGSVAGVGNSVVSAPETVMLSTSDVGGEQIQSFALSSFEGRIDQITVSVAPAPGALGALAIGGLVAVRRRR